MQYPGSAQTNPAAVGFLHFTPLNFIVVSDTYCHNGHSNIATYMSKVSIVVLVDVTLDSGVFILAFQQSPSFVVPNQLLCNKLLCSYKIICSISNIIHYEISYAYSTRQRSTMPILHVYS